MLKIRAALFFFILAFAAQAQDLRTSISDNKNLDSLRKKEANKPDSVVFNSRYIRYTTARLSKDSLTTYPLDTTLNNIQNYSVLYQPRRPTTGLGNLGLAARPMLYEARKNIGFDPGFQSLDLYYLNADDILFYRARTPFSSLYYVNGGDPEQVFKVIYTQNIKKNWNAGVNFNRIGANGFYNRQRGDDLGASFFSWYQSPNNRYNLFATLIFNTLKAAENGSLYNDSLFNGNALDIDRKAESIRLNNSRQLWRRLAVSLKNTYFIGRIDSSVNVGSTGILPTNKVTYNLNYTRSAFSFFKDEKDDYTALPKGLSDYIFSSRVRAGYTLDSTSLHHLQNEVLYSFFLRPKSKVFQNELKINAGIRHDLYQYEQSSRFSSGDTLYLRTSSFQNITLLGNAGYRFSDRFDLNVDVEQIIQGQNFGDFLYEAKSNVRVSEKLGSMVLGAYIQNRSPEQIYERHFSNHYSWDVNLDNMKTLNFNASYINRTLGLDLGAEYFLISNYMYFTGTSNGLITPAQETGDISLLRFTLGKQMKLGRFHVELYGVYQKTDNEYLLRTPEVYGFGSVYFDKTFFKVLKTQIGFDMRYNTPTLAYSYSAAASQFYIGNEDLTLGSKPVASVWIKAALRRANLFVKYDYVNQGLFNQGFYTTRMYPMGDRLFKFGVMWNFYD